MAEEVQLVTVQIPGMQGPRGVPSSSNGTVLDIIKLTQDEYNALVEPVPTTMYVIVEVTE